MTDNSANTNAPTRRGVPIWALVLIVIAAAAITFLITALIMNISDRKGEADLPTYTPVAAIDDSTYDPAVWGENFPYQYDGWAATDNFMATDHNVALVQREPTPEDPRTETTASKLDEDPRLKTMWNGYAFAIDYRHLRGHAHMMLDQNYTQRVQPPRQQPGACLNCHVSTVEVYDELGNGDRDAGFAAMNKLPYAEAAAVAKGPIGCIDCHDPATMELRITRPGLMNALTEMKAEEGIANYDVNKDATTEEMRSYVCAQCHVEYYFAGDAKTLTFPWKYGTDIDDVWTYYQEVGFTDFKHATTEAQIVKAQHPEFEAWSESVHADNGVSCADCHMAYKREGAQKISDHDVTTPLANINGTCGTCHTSSEQVIKDRVTEIQNRFVYSRDRGLDALTQLIAAIEKAKTDGTPQAQIDAALQYQNKASFYIDYAYSENSYGFHAPDYFQRVINESLDNSRKGQLALLGVAEADLAPSDVTLANAEHAAESGLK